MSTSVTAVIGTIAYTQATGALAEAESFLSVAGEPINLGKTPYWITRINHRTGLGS
ncbi:MAG: hypothetical protein ACYC0X_12090 [Pirellulaceae bacterium]